MFTNEEIRDKILGNFLGVSIGDALGKPVEGWSHQRIVDKFDRIENYHNCSDHKYFENDPSGTTTDDWQLTKAVAQAMITSGELNLDEIASEHVKEFSISVRGWGTTTREAVGRIDSGVSWKESGKFNKENYGVGNGVCMKISPVGLHMALTDVKCNNVEYIEKISDMSIMTHATSMGVTSGLSHAFATLECFNMRPEEFNKNSFINVIIYAATLGRQYCTGTLKDDLQTRFEQLYEDYTPMDIINPKQFGGGTCYVYNSLPFTYAWFLRNPNNIESLYDCISAGGDTDTNGSMLAGLLGVLHGSSIFPNHLINGLKNKDEVFELADQFYKRFNYFGVD